jgi:hypothetical protein
MQPLLKMWMLLFALGMLYWDTSPTPHWPMLPGCRALHPQGHGLPHGGGTHTCAACGGDSSGAGELDRPQLQNASDLQACLAHYDAC